jgi:hypothetical protein
MSRNADPGPSILAKTTSRHLPQFAGVSRELVLRKGKKRAKPENRRNDVASKTDRTSRVSCGPAPSPPRRPASAHSCLRSFSAPTPSGRPLVGCSGQPSGNSVAHGRAARFAVVGCTLVPKGVHFNDHLNPSPEIDDQDPITDLDFDPVISIPHPWRISQSRLARHPDKAAYLQPVNAVSEPATCGQISL